jgi:hypothetical protein
MIKSIEEWLERAGYPLELAITKTLRELDFTCFKSMLYQDWESNKAREIDLIAEAAVFNGDNYLQGTLVIECKKSTKPFVVLCDDDETFRIGEYVLHDSVITNRCGKFIVDAQSIPKPVKFFRDARCQYSVVRLESDIHW